MPPKKEQRNARAGWPEILFVVVSLSILVVGGLFFLLVIPYSYAAYECEDITQEFLMWTTTTPAPEWCERIAP